MHTIRLRGPWLLEPMFRYVKLANGVYQRSEVDLPPASKLTMPADWSTTFGSDFIGRVRYVRTFNSPTGLQPDERVWLVVEPQRSAARVMMAEETLGVVASEGLPQRFDITHLLSPHNRLEIFVDHPPLDGDCTLTDDPERLLPGGLVGEVWLEIEEGR